MDLTRFAHTRLHSSLLPSLSKVEHLPASNDDSKPLNTTPAHLLVVDDELDSLELIISYLRDFEFGVTTTTSGREAIEIATAGRPDLLLLDLSLPDTDGLEVLRQLKQIPATQTIPVLLITGHQDVERKVTGFELGAADYLTKPVVEAEVLARVTAHLRQSRLQGALKSRLLAYEHHYGPLEDSGKSLSRDVETNTDLTLLTQARRILLKSLDNPPSLIELARLVGTNQPRLSKGFRTLYGTTVYGFVRETRMRRARDLLTGTRLPVKSIALEVGYRSTSDLTRSIKARYGLTPTQLRQRLPSMPAVPEE